MPGHTPAPWVVSRHGGAILGGEVHDFARGSGQSQVAVATMDAVSSPEERDANARLIAAAPDLLAAAVALRDAQRAYMADRGNESLGRAVGEAAATLDVAISKATGQ